MRQADTDHKKRHAKAAIIKIAISAYLPLVLYINEYQ